MCGIAGFFTKNAAVSASVLEAMTGSLVHRGPDDQGFFGVEPNSRTSVWKEAGEWSGKLHLGMGFRRLSILDLSSNGAQPMCTEDGRFWLCFNGQIYNYLELRKEFPETRFRSTSDTEVLLYLFAKYRLDCLSKLKGIFAFAVFDTLKQELYLARDPLGVKPLYYFQDGRGFFFSSELRSLLKACTEKPNLRTELLSRYLMANWLPDPDTLLEGVFKVPAGHCARISRNAEVQISRYWDFEFSPDEEVSKAEWVERLDGALNASVRRQLRSDVPVAFFLSGGLDSSLLTQKGVELTKSRVTTFTTGFRWSHSKEDQLDLKFARKLRDKLSIDYREIILEPSIVSLLPKVVGALEEPVADPAAICSYLICETASKEFKVLISGQGGDELFGGYPTYRAGWLASGVKQWPPFLQSLLQATSQALPYSIEGRRLQTLHRMKKFLLSTKAEWPIPFLLLRSAMGNLPVLDLLSPDLAMSQIPPFASHLAHFERAKQWDVMHQMLYLDLKTYLVCPNLFYSDKTSMAHSVELRVPLLDLEVVNLMQRVPSRYKVTLKESKILLKALAEKYLPHEIVHRKKTGFGLPLRDWFLNELQPMARDLLSESRLRAQGFFNPAVCTRWLNEHREKAADHSMKIYSLMAFQLWIESFPSVSPQLVRSSKLF